MQKMYRDHGYLPPPNKTLDYFSLDVVHVGQVMLEYKMKINEKKTKLMKYIKTNDR